MSFFSILVLIGSVQGYILALALSRLKESDLVSNRYLSLFLFVVSTTLLGRFFYTDTEMTILKFKLLFFGDCIIFLFGPFLYLWLTRVLGLKKKFNKKELVHFVPALIFFLSVTPLFFSFGQDFWMVLNKFGPFYSAEELGAILHNLIYIVISLITLRKFEANYKDQASTEPQTTFYRAILSVSLVAVIVWLVSNLLGRFSPDYMFSNLGYHSVWVIMSSTILGLGYYTIRNPELFLPDTEEPEEEVKAKKPIDGLDKYLEKIEQIMTKEKAYLDPKLTLGKFSESAGIHTHLLSRIINEHYEKNFFDFVNSYRVEEFKEKITQENLVQFTILKLALESGFNSKTTFNKSFKKNTGETPKEYIDKQLILS